MSFLCSIVLLFVISVEVTLSIRTGYGDCKIYLSQNEVKQNQLNIFQGDEFLVVFKMRSPLTASPADLSVIKISQYVMYTEAVETEIDFVRVSPNIYRCSKVHPLTHISGRNSSVISASYYFPLKYVTDMIVINYKQEEIDPQTAIQEISINSYGVVTNPGIKVNIVMNPTLSFGLFR